MVGSADLTGGRSVLQRVVLFPLFWFDFVASLNLFIIEVHPYFSYSTCKSLRTVQLYHCLFRLYYRYQYGIPKNSRSSRVTIILPLTATTSTGSNIPVTATLNLLQPPRPNDTSLLNTTSIAPQIAAYTSPVAEYHHRTSIMDTTAPPVM